MKTLSVNVALHALQLKAKQQVYTLLSGHNLSKLHGEGYDFSELREYQIGDDIRKINWMITAKLGKPYIKELHANRELSIVVATFMDGSLYFGTGNSKQHTLTEVASILGYVTLQQNDLFTGFAYTQHQTYTTPPTKQFYHIESFSKTIFEASLLDTQLDNTTSLQNLFESIQKPSLIFVIGDFLEDMDLSVLSQKHEVVAIIIRQREEEYPKRLGEVTFVNPQGLKGIQTYFGKSSIETYLENLQKHDLKLDEHFTKHKIKSVKIFTDEAIIEKLLPLFH